VSLLYDASGFARYARGLRTFLAEPLLEPAARQIISHNLASREAHFLTLLGRAVFDDEHSPYARLFRHAGIELGDVAGMVRADGIEATLGCLHDKGVWLALAEAKGKQPVRRGELEFTIGANDLHNKLISRDFEGTTGGSRSSGTRFWVDLEDVRHVSAYMTLARSGHDIARADGTIWLPAPPGVAGIRRALWWSKAGMRITKWFAQSVPRWRPGEFKRAAFVHWTASASRRAGRALPRPQHTPPAEALRVASWLSDAVQAGNPGVLFCTPSSAVRVCAAAADAGLPLEGTFFSLGGEPYTDAKAQAIGDVGGRADSCYSLAELGGPIAVGCPNATEVDEAHLAADRIAIIDVDRPLPNGEIVPALYATTVSPLAPQVAIHLETGDYAKRGRPQCGCPFDLVGLADTVHTVRSYEKLSTEGMHFFGPRLVTLLEHELPRRFGGGPTDYQLIEQEDPHGRSRISLAVSPRIGALDERRVVEAALAFLAGEGPAQRMMAEIWTGGDTLQVVRREPVVSGASKVLALHVLRGSRTS
jgi:hypothetical protein